MKYLLSNGRVTSSLRDYIGDLIRLNLLIRRKEIPYWRGGSEDIVESITEDEIINSVRDTVNSIINRISNIIADTKTTLSLNGVYSNNNNIRISVLIGDKLENYDIKRGY
nr:MAG TPA: hypothetical protein [Bacteriophage sp.]